MKLSKLRLFTVLAVLVVWFAGFTTVAYAYAAPEVTAPEIQPGEPLSQGSDIVTRDLLYDKATNKQFITIQDRDGNIFYLVIDYDAPVNEDEEQYAVYFLNPVDTADLAALAGEEQAAPIVCTCTDHCIPGAIDMGCPVCAADMTQCAVKEVKPVEITPPEPEIEPEPEPSGNAVGMALAVLFFAALAGGGAVVYLKFFLKKNQAKPSPDLDDYEYEDDEEYGDGGDYEDDEDYDSDEESEEGGSEE